MSFIFDKLALPSEYEVCLKSNGTAHAARTTFIAEKKSIAFYDVTMSYGFENQISTFCNNYTLFCMFFFKALSLQPFCEDLIKIRIFGFFFFDAKDERRITNQREIFCST